jgi:hypothetical protein
MVWWWWIVPAAAAVIGLTLVLGAIGWLFKGKPFKAGRGVVGGGALLAVAGIASLLGLNIQTYNRLTFERPVAIVSAREIGIQTYQVTLCQPGGEVGTYTVNGDEWRLEAYVLKWKPWANVVGLDAQYKLDRLSGRYRSTEQELTAPRSAYDMRAEDAPPAEDANLVTQVAQGFDVMNLPEPLRRYAPAVDATYGNGVFIPMRDGGVSQVWFTQDSLIARAGAETDLQECVAGRGAFGDPDAAAKT